MISTPEFLLVKPFTSNDCVFKLRPNVSSTILPCWTCERDGSYLMTMFGCSGTISEARLVVP